MTDFRDAALLVLEISKLEPERERPSVNALQPAAKRVGRAGRKAYSLLQLYHMLSMIFISILAI